MEIIFSLYNRSCSPISPSFSFPSLVPWSRKLSTANHKMNFQKKKKEKFCIAILPQTRSLFTFFPTLPSCLPALPSLQSVRRWKREGKTLKLLVCMNSFKFLSHTIFFPPLFFYFFDVELRRGNFFLLFFLHN